MPIITDSTPVTFSDPLPEAVDVVIIGAGIVGTSTAWFLAQHGAKVLLCEKGRVAGEQSSRNWGWVRQQGRDSAELPIMMEANRIWRDLAASSGEKDLGFTPSGCVYLAETERQLAKYESWYALARQHQLDTRMLSRDEASALAAHISGRWIGGMFTASDGRAEPFVAVPAMARAASKLGAVIIEDCAVRSVETQAGRVSGAVTEKGAVRTACVLLAGGAWSSRFAANLGLDLPQLVVRSTAGRTNSVSGKEMPNISMADFAIRSRDDGGYTIATGDVVEHYVSPQSFKYFTKFLALMKISAKDVRVRLGPPCGYPGAWGAKRRWTGDQISPFEEMRVLDPPPSEAVRRRLKRRLRKRAPWLEDVGIEELWAGMIDVTPDVVPYVCEVPAPGGLFIGTGMSGHGFGIGPGVGRILADLIQGRPPGHDLCRFRFERFSDGSPIVPGPY
ncbi:MAG: FAD-binding oxidoreductase [Gammaproteobacteria bacterium]|nr:MAG: FAD-binding oxidoreductase [Gammaproteobacteria bacterium]